jgi:flagellar basal body-associated protein FliL
MDESNQPTESQPKRGANWGAIALLVLIPVALIVMVASGFWTLSPDATAPKSTASSAPVVRPAPAAPAADAGAD